MPMEKNKKTGKFELLIYSDLTDLTSDFCMK